MRKYILTVICLGLLCSNVYAGSYSNLTPGTSTKQQTDAILGQPLQEIIKGQRYDYDPTAHDLKRISVTYGPSATVETISLYFQEPYSPERVKEWFGLNETSQTTIDSLGNLIEYCLDDGISLYHDGPDNNSPVSMLSYFDPQKLMQIAGQNTPKAEQVEWQGKTIEVADAQPTSRGQSWTRLPVARELPTDMDIPRVSPEPSQPSAPQRAANPASDADYQRGYAIGQALGRLLLGAAANESQEISSSTDMRGTPKANDSIVPAGLEPSPLVGNVIFFDDFNGENSARGALNYSAYKNWDVIAGTTDLIGNGFWDSDPKRGLHLDLDGSTMAGGTIISKNTFNLIPGKYRLQFDLSGNPFSTTGPNTIIAGFQGIQTGQFTLTKNDGFTTLHMDIDLSSPQQTKLIFRDLGKDNQGALLDNVILTQLSVNPSFSGNVSTVGTKEYEDVFKLAPLSDDKNAQGHNAIDPPPVQEMDGYSQSIDQNAPAAPHKIFYQGRWVVFSSRAEKEYFEQTHNIK